MEFKKQVTNVDYGTTTIENIFINDFMPMANGTFVKVYLMAYKYACETVTNVKISNSILSKHLDLSLEDVLSAWDFWEQKGVIKKIVTEGTSDYGIEFLSLRQLFVENNFEVKKNEPDKTQRGYTSSPNNLVEALKVPVIKQMFHDIEYIIRRQLVPKECQDVLDSIFAYKMDPDMITAAFDYSFNKMNQRKVNYVKAVLRNWYDDGIISTEKLEEHFDSNTDLYLKYKKIYKILGYGSKPVSAGDKEVMTIWLDQLKLSMDYLERVLTESSKKTSNINMNYMNSIIKGLYEDNIRDLDTYEAYLMKKQVSTPQNTGSKVRKTTNRFQNFEGTMSKLKNDDIEKMMLRKSKNRKEPQE